MKETLTSSIYYQASPIKLLFLSQRAAATDLAEAIDLKDACVHIECVGASGKGKVEAFVLEFGGKIAGKGVLNKGMKATDVTLIIADPRHVGKYQAWAKGRN